MYCRTFIVTATSPVQLEMWYNNIKHVASERIFERGALQIITTRTSENKCMMSIIWSDKKKADSNAKEFSERLKQLKEFLKVEISEGEILFNLSNPFPEPKN